MGKANLVIRLIDIVFILLFAFIAISQVGNGGPIEPPKSTEATANVPDNTHTIVIGIEKNGTYPVENGKAILKNTYDVRQYLTKKIAQAASEGAQLGIRICASWDSPVEYSLAVAKICRDMNIQKGLDVVKFSSN